METSEPVQVYSTLSPAEAEIIRGMLEEEGIDAKVAGDFLVGFPDATPDVAVLVHADDAERARDLIVQHQAQRPKSDEEE
jgi:hypothetical protein